MANDSAVDVAIIGGGIGGLCLAQGLVKRGVNVRVYERDRSPTDRLSGYRIHIDRQGARALHDCLPAHLWHAFLDNAGPGGQDFTFLTDQLDELLVIPGDDNVDPADSFHSISRITLRQILLSGLSNAVHFGKTFERYSRDADGTVTMHFADGATGRADVMVAADGGTSRVRQQYLPHAERIDTGITTIAGKFPLTVEAKKRIYHRFWQGPNLILPPKRSGFFVAPHELKGKAVSGEIGVTEREGVHYDNASSYILWAFGDRVEHLPSGLAGMSRAELQDTVAQKIREWHPDLLSLVTESDPETVSLLPVRTSVPAPAWTPSNITLLGDAIHSMSPMRGVGANTALRDARGLCAALTCGQSIVEAIGSYESAMRDYGFAAVRDSLQAAHIFAAKSAVGRTGFKMFLRTAEHVPALKRKIFS